MASTNGLGPAVFAAPLRYIQGKGAIDTLGDELGAAEVLAAARPLRSGCAGHRRRRGSRRWRA